MGKNRSMIKLILVVFLCALVAAGIIVAILAVTVFKPVPVLVDMGEPIQLSIEQDDQTMGPFFTYTAGLRNEGTKEAN